MEANELPGQEAEPAPSKTLVFRVIEWSAWLPRIKDEQSSGQFQGVHGETGIEIEEGERLADLDVLNTGKNQNVPIPHNGDDPAGYQAVSLIVFRATMARVVTAVPPKDVSPPPPMPRSSGLIMPGDKPAPGGPNRKQRRAQ